MPDNKPWTADDMPDLSDKTIVVTGGKRDRSSSPYINDSIVANLFVMNSLVVEPASRTLWHSTINEPFAPFGEMIPFSRWPAGGKLADPRQKGAISRDT